MSDCGEAQVHKGLLNLLDGRCLLYLLDIRQNVRKRCPKAFRSEVRKKDDVEVDTV